MKRSQHYALSSRAKLRDLQLPRPSNNPSGKTQPLPFVIPSAAEGSAVAPSQQQPLRKNAAAHFVIPSEAEGSAVAPSQQQPLRKNAAAHFVIPGEAEGSAVAPSSNNPSGKMSMFGESLAVSLTALTPCPRFTNI
jgi:hypothetical protein